MADASPGVAISATIITLDEERNIARAVDSVAFCDEVLVVDSGSTDRTVEIARDLGARVVCNDWPGYAAQKNFADDHARNDWILSIDADEALSPELAAEIVCVKQAGPACAGYDFPRRARYCGRWIRHSGWYPDRKVRLYRRDLARWTGSYVHESVRAAGPVGHLKGDLLHYTCDSLEQHRASIERYTDLAAREICAAGRSVPAWRLLLGPCLSFARSYLLRLGLLDGRAGFTIARMASRYTYLKYSKARQLPVG